MADLIGNPNIAAGVQVPNQMSLADMVQLARGVQAYKQAELLNPLAAQKAQMEIEQLQKLNPLAVRKATAETTSQEIGAQKAQLDLDQSHFNLAGNILGGLESRAKRLREKNDVKTALGELSYAEKWMNTSGAPSKPDGPFAIARNKLQAGDWDGYEGALENMRNIMGGAASRFQANLPQPSTVGGAPATFTPASGVAKPMEIGGQSPQQTPVVGQPAAPQAAAQPQGVTPTQMQLQYPVRRAGDIRPYAPNEQVDQDKGVAYRNALTARQTDLATARRNLDEVIKEATKIEKEDLFSSGVLGGLTRTIKGWAGDPKYKQLSKDLANVQIANIQAQGGSMDTVAGQQLQKMANGDETFPPDVLINIARRTYADLTNLDMQATGAAKFAQRYGDANLNSFKRQWAANADSKVFEAISIFENVKDPSKRKEAIDKLFGDDPKQRQIYFNKYNNIKKLTETGEL